MIDIGLLFSEMWRRSATISYQKLNYESWHSTTPAFKREYTRFCQHGAPLWHTYCRYIARSDKNKSLFWHTLLKDGSREEGAKGSGSPNFFGGDPPPPFFNRTPPPPLVSTSIQEQSNTFCMAKVNCRRAVKNITKIGEISALSGWSKLIQNAPYITMHHL